MKLPLLLRGLGDWIDSAGPADVPAAFRTPSASIHATGTNFTETVLNTMISSIYRETGTVNDLMLVADTALRNEISDFARSGNTNDVRSINYNGSDSEIKLSVDLYQSDHGIVSVVNGNPDCMPAVTGGTANGAGYLVNPEYYGVHELIPLGSTRLPNMGGGERGYVDCSLTLGVYHPGAHGYVQAIS